MWFGWFYLLSPCAALLPLLPGGPARHCVPRPSAAWHSLPDTMQQPSLHARASELRAAAGQGPRGPGLQRPSPPAEGIPWPFGHAHIHRVGWVGKKFGWLALDVDRGRCASGRSRAGGSGCCGCERVGVRRSPELGCAVVPRVRGAVQTEFLSSVASLKTALAPLRSNPGYARETHIEAAARQRTSPRARGPDGPVPLWAAALS